MVKDFPEGSFAAGLSTPALLPGAVALRTRAGAGWTVAGVLRTEKNSWNETGPIRGEISRDPGQDEQPGPLPVVLALTRAEPRGPGEQRVLVVGDGDFLSNANLASAGNRALGLRMAEWLTAPPGSAAVPARRLPDRELALTRREILVVGGGSLVGLPLFLLGIGLFVRWRRTRE
jgi:hypothetical protein